MFQHPKCSKMVPLWYENHILASCWPSEIVPKSMPKRLQNRLYLGYPLGTLKNTIFDVKTSPRWTPKISDFFQKSSKNASYHGLWSKMPLGSLQEPPKSLQGASQEPFKGPQEAPKSLQEAANSLLRAVSEAPKRPVPCSRCQVSGVRCQVSGVRCQVPGARCQVSGVRC